MVDGCGERAAGTTPLTPLRLDGWMDRMAVRSQVLLRSSFSSSSFSSFHINLDRPGERAARRATKEGGSATLFIILD